MRDFLRESLAGRSDLRFAVQEPQRGTAHALQQAEPVLAGRTGTVVLLSGDVPLLSPRTLRRLVELHTAAKAGATVVTAVVERPYGYGRIVRGDGHITRIVEERDASPAERQIKEINSGIYAFDLVPLFEALRGIASHNAQGEFYLTDLITIYRRRSVPVETLVIDNPQEIRGINSRTELAEGSKIVRQQKNEELMAAGVTIVDPDATYIDPDVQIGADTVIHPGAVIEGQTRIGVACDIQAHVRIVDSDIADRVTVMRDGRVTGDVATSETTREELARMMVGREVVFSRRPTRTVEAAAPVALALAGVTPAADKPLDGVNLLPYFSGQKSGDPHEVLYWRMKARRIWAVRMGDWKLVAAHGWHDIPASVTKPRLINLASDVGELNDLSAQNPEQFAALKAAYDAWEKTLPEPLWSTDTSEEATKARAARSKRQKQAAEKANASNPAK